MPAAPPINPAEGRALRKGVRRALPLFIILIVMASGAALTAQALYIPIKAQVAQIMLTRAFDASVQTGAPVKPWSWADTAPMAKATARIAVLISSPETFGPTDSTEMNLMSGRTV